VPSKGGVGVTTIALNFALALTKESGAKVVVVDMDFQLGEIAPGLGMTATFSVVDALANAARLDREFLATLLIRHSSGLAVLGSPESTTSFTWPTTKASRSCSGFYARSSTTWWWIPEPVTATLRKRSLEWRTRSIWSRK
jgi:Flp pilus assembly CpaE family ATPase